LDVAASTSATRIGVDPDGALVLADPDEVAEPPEPADELEFELLELPQPRVMNGTSTMAATARRLPTL
jgi:hypothetical protein